MLPCWGVHPTRVFIPGTAVLRYHLQTAFSIGQVTPLPGTHLSFGVLEPPEQD